MTFETLDAEMAARTARFIKAELKRGNITYAQLAERLKPYGLIETRNSISGKLKRGTFSATFFLATLKAIGRRSVNVEEI